MKTITIHNGVVTFIDEPALASLRNLGPTGWRDGKAGHMRRVSHVEPNDNDEWEADMSPVGGPVLGPFTNRADALAEEVRWLKQNYL